MSETKLRNQLPGRHATIPLALAVLCLLVGTLVYLFARAPGDAYLIPRIAFDLPPGWRVWIEPVTGPLPTFTHTVAFALLTAVQVLPGRRGALRACVLWFGIETLFEVGQADPVATRIAELLPAWFTRVPVLDHAGTYFLNGTFDPLDLVAAALGAITAYWILRRMQGRTDYRAVIPDQGVSHSGK